MRQNISNQDLERFFSSPMPESAVIDCKIEEAYKEIRRKQKIKRTQWRRMIKGIGAVAAVFVIVIGFCMTNPVLAANIPLLGNVFERVQEVFEFGRIPEEETLELLTEDSPIEENLYQVSDNGITVTYTEQYLSNQAIYIGVCIESEEAFPEFVVMGDTEYQVLQVGTTEEYSFRENSVRGAHDIQGYLENEHLFIGVMRIDFDDIKRDSSKYDKACEEAEKNGEPLPELTEETQHLYVEEYEVPEEFQLKMQLHWFKGYCIEEKFKKEGNWGTVTFNLEISKEDMVEISVDEVGEAGVGLSYVEISPVEMTVHPIEPQGYQTFAVVLDKDGKKLMSGDDNAHILTTNGHDLSEFTVYICNYVEYMDEIKVQVLENGEGDWKSILEERAIFKKNIKMN